ncbi:hypothetical protein BV898_06191 [Hypsibius exemplaris]|uniref:Uncharacterized protein n=1 Tax=Hypsibius exemplaris TaxID=2072580 RepID=A0A1W0WXJ2_HYPEX|nr:hypothetical protein BV898_06191 [Hypsibius exemplaris]
MHGLSEVVRDAARNFEQEIAENPEELTISGNGFFSMNKSFAATLFGVVLTYFLLIYQQKDQKADLAKVSNEQQAGFLTLTRQIEELAKRLNETLGGCATA